MRTEEEDHIAMRETHFIEIPRDIDLRHKEALQPSIWFKRISFRRRNLVRLLPFAIVGLVFVVVVGLLGIQHFIKSPEKVSLYTVAQGTMASYIGGGGLTYPLQRVDIAYPISTQVLEVQVQVGQVITPGQSLLTLDATALNAQLDTAYSQWREAVSYLNTLQGAGSLPAQIAGASSDAAIAKSRYDALNSQINSPAFNHGNVVAKMAGVVGAVNVVPGDLFEPNEVLMTIQDISTIIVRAQFPLDQRDRVQVGSDAEVIPAATPSEHFQGKVTTIAPALSNVGSNTFETWISVPNTEGKLFTGQSVYARVVSQRSLLIVPQLAVINPESDATVFVYVAGRARIRHVTIDARNGDTFGLSGGVQVGDQVILSGKHQLLDGDQVTVTSNP